MCDIACDDDERDSILMFIGIFMEDSSHRKFHRLIVEPKRVLRIQWDSHPPLQLQERTRTAWTRFFGPEVLHDFRHCA